jgi:hypothetical protein
VVETVSSAKWQLEKFEAMVLKWMITKGRNAENRGS